MSCGLRPVRGFLLFRAFQLAKIFCQVWLRLYVAGLLATVLVLLSQLKINVTNAYRRG